MRWRYPLLVVLGIAVHATWAMLLLIRRGELKTVGLHGIHLALPWHITAIFLLATCVCAVLSLRQKSALKALFLLVPQQAALIASAIMAAVCTWNGEYADGVQRPWEFIGADQSYVIYLAFLHAYAIWSRCHEGTLTRL